MKAFYLIILSQFFIFSLAAQTGCLHGDCANGNGTYIWDNGDMYTGEWKDGLRNGYGRYDWNDGGYYIGNFLNDEFDGEGSYYASNGSNMIGYFKGNTYLGTEKPSEEKNTETAKNSNSTDSSLDSLLHAFDNASMTNKKLQRDALANANYYDFATTVQTAVNAFANNFERLKGVAQNSSLSIGESWFSNLLVKGTTDAMVVSGFLNDHNAWYNVLYKSANFDDAKYKYNYYVNEFNEQVRTACCTLTYDAYDDYKSENYESYGTYWITFLTQEGYDEEIYGDLLIEIEMSSSILDKGYEVIIRISHLSDNK